MIPLYDRVTSRHTGLTIDIFKPTELDGEWWILKQTLGVKFIFQCTAHKTIVGGNVYNAATRTGKDPTVWCPGCKGEDKRFKEALAYQPGMPKAKLRGNGAGARIDAHGDQIFKQSYLLKSVTGESIKQVDHFDRSKFKK